jgi:hypothetical protein
MKKGNSKRVPFYFLGLFGEGARGLIPGRFVLPHT